jgi:dihydroneopterin aldolase
MGVVGDRIELRGLRVLAHCGVLPEEQERRQPFSIDLDLDCDLAAAGRTDDLTDTVDYGAVCEAVARLAADERYALLERFAQAIADVVLAHEAVASVTVAVAKLRPPVPQDLACSGVRITRTRAEPGSAPDVS